MGFEFIAAIALIIALSELREWRQTKRDERLEQSLGVIREHIAKMAHTLDAQAQELAIANERYVEQQSFVNKAGADLDALARMIDVHGVRVKFQPGALAPDYVEGL